MSSACGLALKESDAIVNCYAENRDRTIKTEKGERNVRSYR